jgi:predicted DNA-binding protein (MmcQ/YjbR family)
MNFVETRRYILERPEAKEDFPFGPDVAVFKLQKKMFATLVQSEDSARMNLKCDPNEALILRDIFDAVLPGYHMNKRHWNTVVLDGSIPRGEIERMIDSSYSLVARGLPLKARQGLEIRHGRDAIYGKHSG